MAIIPFGLLTTPSTRKLLINRPCLPGGRFSGEPPPPLVSLPNNGAKGSRREMFSRTATGLMAAAATGVGTSDLPAVSGLELAVGAVAPPEGLIPGASTVLTAVVVPTTGFDPGVGPEAGFAVDVLTGFAVGFAATGLAVELGTEADAALDPGVAGLAPAVVGAADFDPDVASGVVFAVEVLAGLLADFTVVFGVAAVPTAEIGADEGTGRDVGAAGLAVGVVAAADFGVCALDAAIPAGTACFARAVFPPAAGLAGAAD